MDAGEMDAGEMDAGALRVVAAAIVRDGRLLAARRTAPAALVGRWELTGGKVEVGESDEVALVREVTEELGVLVAVETWLPGVQVVAGGPAVPGGRIELRVAVTRLVEGEPCTSEHDELRWLGVDELDDVEWLEPDRPFVEAVAEVLRAQR